MKALILTVALGVASVSVCAQGALAFSNVGPGLNAKVTDWSTGVGLIGSTWEADLYWAEGTVVDSQLLTALNAPATFDSQHAGYFFGGARTIPGVAGGGQITAQVRVWNTAYGSSWDECVRRGNCTSLGESILFQVTLASVPDIPPFMTGLNGHPWQVGILVPEPSMLALEGLGLAAILILRRRH